MCIVGYVNVCVSMMWFSSGSHCYTVDESGEAAHDSNEVSVGGDRSAGGHAMEESGMVVHLCCKLCVTSSRCDDKCVCDVLVGVAEDGLVSKTRRGQKRKHKRRRRKGPKQAVGQG